MINSFTFHRKLEYLLKTVWNLWKFGSIPLTARLLISSRITSFEWNEWIWATKNDLNSKCLPQKLHRNACPFKRLNLCFWHCFDDINCFGQKRQIKCFFRICSGDAPFVLWSNEVFNLMVSNSIQSECDVNSLWDNFLDSTNFILSPFTTKAFAFVAFALSRFRFFLLRDFVISLISFLKEIMLKSPRISINVIWWRRKDVQDLVSKINYKWLIFSLNWYFFWTTKELESKVLKKVTPSKVFKTMSLQHVELSMVAIELMFQLNLTPIFIVFFSSSITSKQFKMPLSYRKIDFYL